MCVCVCVCVCVGGGGGCGGGEGEVGGLSFGVSFLSCVCSFGRCVNSDQRSDQCHVLEQSELLKVS